MSNCGFRALSGTSVLLFGALAHAQCDPTYRAGLSVPGANGPVQDLADGGAAGLYACGDFTVVGSTYADRIARWDGTTWHALGTGLDDLVEAVVVLPNGDVVAGGRFGTAGGAPIASLARWDGIGWQPFGGGISGRVSALHVLANGDLLVGGSFTPAAPTLIQGLARWDGTNWSSVGGNVDAGTVLSITSNAQGEIVIGGTLDLTINGVVTEGLAIWDGTSWAGPAAVELNHVSAVQAMPNGDIVFGGPASFAGNCLGTYDGQAVQFVANPLDRVFDLALDTNGVLVAGGWSNAQDVSVVAINGGIATVLDAEPYDTRALAVVNGNLIAAGQPYAYPTFTGLPSIREFDGVQWHGLGADSLPVLEAIAVAPDGDVYVGGSFTEIAGVPAAGVARFDGTAWTSLGLGIVGRVEHMAFAPSGDLICFGSIASAGGSPVQRIARWDGASWSSLGGGLTGLPVAMTVAGNGDIAAVVTVGPNLRVFDGLTWNGLPPIPEHAPTMDCATLSDGSLVFCGITQSGFAWRWDGSAWSAIGSSPAVISHVAPTADGGMFLQGSYQGTYGIHRWNGSTMQFVGQAAGAVADMEVLPNGDLVIVGSFTSVAGQPARGVARYDGQTWSEVDGGVREPYGSIYSRVDAVAFGPDGSLNLVGEFTSAGSEISSNFARAESPCPASTSPVGTGCIGSAGLLLLQPIDLPYVGTTFHAQLDVMPAGSIGAYAIGFPAPTVPLPGGAQGCSLFVQPGMFELIVPQSGVGAANVTIPRLVGLAGINLRTQAVVFELDPSLAITQITSSNALDLTIGAF